ncbi:hypothetical protein AVEN_5704-1 [Araneus ventricosus]|uniref:Uncharacterized protein n=1 Tax=Araneus ventricosus TaxID=182803 RepID=A0A4Y2DV41_ARAVE|nr:hypothetical protein AVEN_5704-1 [Araneus ventricosus]
MTRTTPELAPPSPNFHATPAGGRLAGAKLDSNRDPPCMRKSPCVPPLCSTVYGEDSHPCNRNFSFHSRNSAWILSLLQTADSVIFSFYLPLPRARWFNAPQFQLHKILWVALSSTVGLRVECRHSLKSVCLQDVILKDQTDENRLGLSLVGQCYSIHLTAQT